MLELYHNINSVCAQKVRIALHEKRRNAKEHLLKLQGDQNDPGCCLRGAKHGSLPSHLSQPVDPLRFPHEKILEN